MTAEVPLESLPLEQQVEMLRAALSNAQGTRIQEIAQPVIHSQTAYAMYCAAALQGLLASAPEDVSMEYVVASAHIYATRMLEGPDPAIVDKIKGTL